jgi:hypothetical protein
MASYEVERAFRRVAERILNRPITEHELRRITDAYERAPGTTIDRAIRGLSTGLNESEGGIRSKAASSDDVSRLMQDLQTVLDKK